MDTRVVASELRLSHWAQIMRERKESGLSIRAFCANAGFHENIFYYWQRRLREEACAHLAKKQTGTISLAPRDFAEVQLCEPATPTFTGSTGSIHVEVDGIQITADNTYPVESLVMLLKELVRP